MLITLFYIVITGFFIIGLVLSLWIQFDSKPIKYKSYTQNLEALDYYRDVKKIDYVKVISGGVRT